MISNKIKSDIDWKILKDSPTFLVPHHSGGLYPTDYDEAMNGVGAHSW